MKQQTYQSFTSDTQPFGIDDYLVKQIPQRVAASFIEKYHYSGGCGNSIMPWGLYEQANGQLVGVIAFQTPISENVRASVFESISGKPHEWMDVCGCDHIDELHGYREHVTELHRMAIHPDAPKNTATWFISRALKRLKAYKPKYWAVVSFADSTEGHDGTVYQAANADYYGTSRPATFYRDNEGRLRAPRQCGENITRKKAIELGWEIVRRESKHRYVFWLPDAYSSKSELRNMAALEFESYPDTSVA